MIHTPTLAAVTPLERFIAATAARFIAATAARLIATTAARLIAATAACCALVGCAGATGDYPSFAIPTSSTQEGRVSVSFPQVTAPQPVAGDPLADPIPADPKARIAAITNRAARANSAFASSAPTARSLASAARGLSASSDRWAQAQISLADLSSHHSEAQLALAELDLLASALSRADAAPAPALIVEVTAAQTQLATTLDEQGAVLSAISGLLER